MEGRKKVPESDTALGHFARGTAEVWIARPRQGTTGHGRPVFAGSLWTTSVLPSHGRSAEIVEHRRLSTPLAVGVQISLSAAQARRSSAVVMTGHGRPVKQGDSVGTDALIEFTTTARGQRPRLRSSAFRFIMSLKALRRPRQLGDTQFPSQRSWRAHHVPRAFSQTRAITAPPLCRTAPRSNHARNFRLKISGRAGAGRTNLPNHRWLGCQNLLGDFAAMHVNLARKRKRQSHTIAFDGRDANDPQRVRRIADDNFFTFPPCYDEHA